MNDRYLFRAKRIDNGEWVEGYLIADEQNEEKCFIGYVFGTNDDVTPHDFDVVAVDPSTICQCTGLKDKNGKLIWENDILNSGNLVVAWREELASYCLTKKGWMYQHFFGEAVDACDCEVIGNIFDNPELLEVGE